MASFGERLRAEREARNTTIEDVSAATGIRPDYLAALEKNDFHSLPGRAFGKFYIRAYAKTLGIDPAQLLDDYDREQDSRRRALIDPAPVEPAGPRQAETVIQRWRLAAVAEREKAMARAAMLARERTSVPTVQEDPCFNDDDAGRYQEHDEHDEHAEPAPAPPMRLPAPTWSSRPAIAALVFVGLFMAAASVYVVFFRTSLEGSEKGITMPLPAAPPSPAPATDPVPPTKSPRAELAPRPTRPVARGSDAPGSLSVSEFGVGKRVVNGLAAGGETQFAMWDVAWFSTRVLGASPGDQIAHVWLHEGRVMQSIVLRLGGANWRTHSRKTLGKPGQWAVEARDSEGRVLARTTFTCQPPAP